VTKAKIRPASAPEIFEVTELEQLRVLADPLRMRILNNLFPQAHTVKQIADRLELSPTKLYYHFGELERVGLITVVETRVKSGIIEKYYRCVAETIRVSRDLLRLTGQELEQNAYGELLASIMEAVADDLRHAVQAGLLLPPDREDAPKRTAIGRTNVRLKATAAARLVKKWAKLLEEIEAADDPDGDIEFGAAIALFPLKDLSQSEEI
jgi:DNA-binding transcriptional ArsR family regulator